MSATRPRHFPYLDGADPLRMGLAAIPPAAWFEIDGDYAVQMAEKEALLATRRDAVFAALPSADAAAAEVLESVRAWLAAFRGDFRCVDAVVRCPDGRRVALAGEPPLLAASRLVQEDLVLLQPDPGGRLVLSAASLCFPSRWTLAEKLGRPMLAIHAPVPGLNDRLGATIDRLLLGLKRGAIFCRRNWSLTDDPALFQPVALPRPVPPVAEIGARIFLRVERQTLARLPLSGAVLFGIRIHQHPLAAVAEDPAARRGLIDAVTGLDPALTAYKSMQGLAPSVIDYLKAAGPPPTSAASQGKK